MVLSHFLAEGLSHRLAARARACCWSSSRCSRATAFSASARRCWRRLARRSARRHDRAAARDPRSRQELRRARRRARHQLPARGRRAPRADRPQRRRQDHVHQPPHRRAAADRGRRCCSRAATSRAVAQAERVKLGIARTFQINRLFRGLSVLENVYIAVAERRRRGARHVPAGRHAQGRDRGVDASARDAQARTTTPATASPSCPTAASAWSSSRSRSGLKPEVLLLDEPAAGVPSAESHIILDAIDGAAQAHRRADHRARHGPRVPLRASGSRCWWNGAVFAEGTPQEIAADARRARRLSRPGGAPMS